MLLSEIKEVKNGRVITQDESKQKLKMSLKEKIKKFKKKNNANDDDGINVGGIRG